MTHEHEAKQIADKWVAILGDGIHPDTSGADYRPRLSKAQVSEYERDMDRLFEIADDPYEIIIDSLSANQAARNAV